MSDDADHWVQWVYDTCLLFGTSRSTAHKVAGGVAADFESGLLRPAEKPGGAVSEWPSCAGCGEPAEIDDRRGQWWCTECFFDPRARPAEKPDSVE